MDLFMSRVALAAKQEDLKIKLAEILHKPPFATEPLLNFDVVLFSKNDSRGQIGILTLPSADVGNVFLRSYGSSGVALKGSRIIFKPSNRPVNETKVNELITAPWNDPRALQLEKERMGLESRPSPLTQFAFGRFLADGKFVSVYTAQGNAEVACDLERREVRLTICEQHRHSLPEPDISTMLDRLNLLSAGTRITASYPPPRQNASFDLETCITASYPPSRLDAILDSHAAESPVIFLQANAFPIFKSEGTGLHGETKYSRIQGIVPNKPMPPGCYSLMCTFEDETRRRAFLDTCRKRLRVHYTARPIIHVIQDDASFNMEDVTRFLARLPFEVAFEIEKAVVNQVVTPHGALSLQDELPALSQRHPKHVASIFRKLIARLEEDNVPRRRRSRRNRRHRRQNAPGDLVTRLRVTTEDYLQQLQRPRGRLAPSNTATSYTYHMVLTPTQYILEGPNADQSNSVLRRFGNNQYFLRVAFQDENRSKLRGDFETSISELLLKRYRAILLNGCRVAGRDYEFLGYSMSGLRDHSLWFVTPFRDAEGREWNALAIRQSLGDFTQSTLLYQPARLGARWSQAFSATDPSISVRLREIRRIEDRKSPSGTVMTDGCSPISSKLLREIWKAYQGSKKRISKARHPCALQFRLGGAKGMVVEDRTLPGKVVCLRPSQIKFEAPDNRTFDVQATSLRPKAMFLNRPLLALLEFLGASINHILELQDASIAEASSLHNSFQDASKVFQQHGLGTSFHLPSLFNNVQKILHLPLMLDGDQEDHYCSDLLAKSLKCAETHILRELKYRAHIAVPDSFTLFGVSDEWDCLEEGEIFATVRDEKTNLYQEITGRVAVTRSPQIHPGDVQLVTAVRRPELEHLTNVVVFSCKGDRPLASCLGGGDLDGDDFNLILDPDLHPVRTWTPGAYTPLAIKKTVSPCDISDVVDFVFDYASIESDLVGLIAIMHLRFADLNDPSCSECMRLAEHASHAVDFPKTGTPVRFQDIPRLKNQPKPDFLSHEGRDLTGNKTYNSQKLLGQLFRRVPLKEWTPQPWDQEESPSQGETVERALHGVGLYGLGFSELRQPPEELCDEMGHLLEEYCEQLTAIGKAHTLSKNKDSIVSEAELMSGTIMANWSDHHRRREAVNAMNLQTHELVRAVRAEMRAREDTTHPDEDEDFWDDATYDEEEDFYRENRLLAAHFERAWAAWYVAEETLGEDPGLYGVQSFGLVALGKMLELIKAARQLT